MLIKNKGKAWKKSWFTMLKNTGSILYNETIKQKTKEGVPMGEILLKAGITQG